MLYECLTGKRPFQGDTVSDTLAQILKGEPDWMALMRLFRATPSAPVITSTIKVEPHDGDEGVAHICTGPPGRVLHGSMAGDGSMMKPTYRYATGTHTFYRLKLAKGPAEVAEAAKADAEEEIATPTQS